MTVSALPMDRDPREAEPEERPPVNYEVEQALLAAILAENRTWDHAADAGLIPEHFADALHGRIYDICGQLINKGKAASAITLAPFFTDETIDDTKTVRQYLAELHGVFVTLRNNRDYAEILIDLWRRRACQAIAEDLYGELGSPEIDEPVDGIIERAASQLMELRDAPGIGSGPVSFQDASQDWLANVEAAVNGSGIVGVPTGLAKLDKHLGGLGYGHLVVVGGCTAMGKTALANTIAHNAARQEHGVLFWTLEMTSEEMAGRILAGTTGISMDRQRRGDVSGQELGILRQANDDLAKIPLQIEEPHIRTVGALKARARGMKRRTGLDLIVVDYVQQLHGVGRGRATENRTQELTAITRDLKALAKDIQVPVLVLAQLSREVDRRDDKRPRLGDLRESGSIEQDADVVMLMYREFYYLSREEPKKRDKESNETYTGRVADWETSLNKCRNIGEIIIAKNRHGPIGTITLHFDGPGTVFRNEAQGSLV